MRGALAALVLLGAGAASATEGARYPLVWSAEQVVPHGANTSRLVLMNGAFHILTPSLAFSNIATGQHLPLPQVQLMTFADDRHFVGVVRGEQHYFSGGVHGRLVRGELGNGGVQRLRGLGEIQPVAALHQDARLWVAYSRDDERHMRIATFADGADRGEISPRIPVGGHFGTVHDLSVADGRIRLLSVVAPATSRGCTQVSLTSLAAETLTEGHIIRSCIESTRFAARALHQAATDTWYLVGGSSTATSVWRVGLADSVLTADELWRDDAMSSWQALSTVDAVSGALFVTPQRGPAGGAEVVRITLDGAVQRDRLNFTCPSSAPRYSAQLSAGGDAYLLARVANGPGACAHVWRLQ
jgi:hypothetical protein